MNARMYAVTPAVEAAWRELLGRVTDEAGVTLEYLPYPAPQPLEALWRRGDLGCVLMCGYPIALGLADVVPIAAPIPRAPWAAGRPVYRSDLIVRAALTSSCREAKLPPTAGSSRRGSTSGYGWVMMGPGQPGSLE